MIICLNHIHGSSVSGVYPSGGTQLKKMLWWNRFCVTRFAISPSQNTGIEIPISAMIISSGSKMVPRSTAAANPIAIDTTIQITAAPKTSERVTGVALMISGITFAPWFEYDARSRETNSFFIRIRYWMGSGRSSAYWWRISAIVSGFGLRPASRRAGSTPGVRKKMTKTRTVMANSTATVPTSRRAMNVPIDSS
jgi:hypothetical protein